MDPTDPDRIEKQALLPAPPGRVWRALTDAAEFGAWFRVALDGPFIPGQSTTGQVTYPGYEHLRLEAWVEGLEPEALFSFRWHPAAVDPAVDYGREPRTLVEFRLEAAPGGTLLRVVESGFGRLPAARREAARRQNDGGWTLQLENLRRHLLG